MIYQFEKKIQVILNKYEIDKTTPLLCAFSGGADSLSTLIALKKLGYNVKRAIYVNHALRSKEELDREIILNRENAKKLNVAFEIKNTKSGEILSKAKQDNIGIEAAGRELRLSILEQEMNSGGESFIVTGHNRNDRDEWDIISFFRGSLKNTTIPYCRKPFIRPLLNTTHKDAEKYCKLCGFEYSEDSTNKSEDNLRSKIRINLIKSIENVFPSFTNALNIKRELEEFDDEKQIATQKSEYFGLECIAINIADMKNTSARNKVNAVLNAFSSFDKSSYGGRFALSDVREVLALIGENNSKTLLISGIYVFKTRCFLSEEKLIFISKSTVDNAFARRDKNEVYAEENIKIKTPCGTKSALKILKDKKVPRIIRGLIKISDIKNI